MTQQNTGTQLQRFEEGAAAPVPQRAMTEVASSRAAQEVQGMMVIAKKFPRDLIEVESRIIAACKRPGLASVALYSYPRGGTKVEGPSIRLAEEMAASFGNMESGVVEMEQGDGESTVMTYAIDYETNRREVKVFTVKHERSKNVGKGEHRKKVITKLDDPRDIYEMVANLGARRKRACILALIPGDMQDKAIAQCKQTLTGGSTESLVDRAKKAVVAFAEYGVTQELLEERLGHNLAAIDEHELVKLQSIFTSMRDGMSSREDWFNVAPMGDEPASAEDLAPGKKKLAGKKKKDAEAEPEQAPLGLEPEPAADPQGGPEPDEPKQPANTAEMLEIDSALTRKMLAASVERTSANKKRVKGFACIGKNITDINDPTSKEAAIILDAVEAMSAHDVKEAIEAA